jgi:hypothetical protein
MPGSTSAMASALADLVTDPGLRAGYGRRAYAYSAGMHWPEVGAAYRRLFRRVARGMTGTGSTIKPSVLPQAVPVLARG